MKTSFLVASIAAGLTLAGAALARDAQPIRMDPPAFEEIDLDGDGAVTTEEMQQARDAIKAARFANADTDGDGALSVDEIVAAAQNERAERMADRIARMVARLDDNEDGVLQAAEADFGGMQRGGERMFDRMFGRADANDDGSLSAEKYADAQARMAERGGRDGHGPDHGFGHGEGRRHN